jgi:PKD repeat protein
MPKAKFTVNDSDQCFKNHNFIFTNNSTIPVGSNIYNWHFGDGSTSTVSSPSKTYATADSFMVRLIATSNNNCQDTAFKPVVTYAQPLANFSINDSDQCFRGHQFVFTNSSTLSKGSKTNYWTFGDGTSSSQNNPSKTYSTYGNYTVKLKIVSDKGCSDSLSKQVLVYAMPKAKFSVNDSDQCFKNHNFIFTNNSSIPVGSNTYNWHFGDGSSSTVSSPSKTYATADSFMVRLIATSNNNCQDTAFKPVVTYH